LAEKCPWKGAKNEMERPKETGRLGGWLEYFMLAA